MKATLLRFASWAGALLMALALVAGCGRTYGYTSKIVSTGDNELTVADEQQQTQQTHEVAPDAQITLDGQPAALKDLESGDAVEVKVQQRDGKEVATDIKAKSKETAETEKNPLDSSPSTSGTQPSPRSEDPSQTPSAPTPQPAPREPTPAPDMTPTPQERPQADPTTPAPQTKGEETRTPKAEVAEETFHGKITSLGDNQIVVQDDKGNGKTFSVNDDTTFTLDGKDVAFEDLKMDQVVDVTANMNRDMPLATTVDASSK